VESLIKSGAMDCFGCSRASLVASLERVIPIAQKRSRSQKQGQLSLLHFVRSTDSDKSEEQRSGIGLDIPEIQTEEWAEDHKLAYEKENLGLFLSGHPLLPFKDSLELYEVTPLKDCAEFAPETEIRIAFLVTGCKEITTRKGDKMAFCQIEDLTGTGELTLFPEIYKQIKEDVHLDQPFVATIKLSDTPTNNADNEEGPKTLKGIAQDIRLLSETQIPEDQPYRLHIKGEQMHHEDWKELKEILSRYPGKNPVQLIIDLDEAICHFQLSPEFCVSPKQKLSCEVKKWQHKVCSDAIS
jgi:DNA polymerase-3 subunit alpha